jgi:hypothetical protein
MVAKKINGSIITANNISNGTTLLFFSIQSRIVVFVVPLLM